MRYLTIAVAALGMLSVGDAKRSCRPRPTSALVTPTSTSPAQSTSEIASSSTPGSSGTPESSIPASTPISAESTPGSSILISSTTPSASETPASSDILASSTPASTDTPVSSATPVSSGTEVSSTPVSSAASSTVTPVSSETPASSSVESTTPVSSETPASSSVASSTPASSSAESTTPISSETPASSSVASSTPASSSVESTTPVSSETPASSSAASSTPVSSSVESTTPASSTTPVSSTAQSTTPVSSTVESTTPVSSSAASSTPSSSAVTPVPTPVSSTSLESSTTPISSTTPLSSSSAPASTTTPSSTPVSSSLPVQTVDSTVLIIARQETEAKQASDGLLAYGISWVNWIVPSTGATLPVLNSTATHANYGAIIVMDAVSYDYGTAGWNSAVTTEQWAQIKSYQADFNIRLVRINEYPGATTGTTAKTGTPTTVSLTDLSFFPTANLKANAAVSLTGLYAVPASITDATLTKEVAQFSDGSTAAVINTADGVEVWAWYMAWDPSWSLTCAYLQHAHIHWMTRGIFQGKRKIHLSTQIDDIQLSTEMYYPTTYGDLKISIADLEAHIDWQNNINARMPSGSDYWLELGHNGNGDFIDATGTDASASVCDPNEAVDYDQDVEAPHEWVKPIGSGEDLWPSSWTEYPWTLTCAKRDTFASWFLDANNLNQFGHISHTFSHMNLNNATYADAKREIQFNQAWLKQLGIDKATRYSDNGIIPPAITGLYNGDTLQAWVENGIVQVVGDNTRPQTRNTGHPYWPYITSKATNGYDGVTVIPRYSSRIYYNCHTAECTTYEWTVTSSVTGTFDDLLALEKESNVRNLLALQADPYMFHQANMYQEGVASRTIGDQTRKMSLVMIWTEVVTQEFLRLTNWPLKTITQKDLAVYFTDRMALDGCNPKMSYIRSTDGNSIESVVVTADGNSCSVPVPVTIPSGAVTADGGSATADVVGAEPPIQWVTLSGSPVTLKLSTPVSLI
ncbi:unnamed protein product [Clonostachys rosea f. rosea IK726]|uniref:Uncharacterized protein n=1 Tax=Clonostachys rosea f. rosea IK726 TaxID=1349383 RepID=A0ACA9TFZ2_BIOOC|nr:unnamed protein product [Clonostachys rosea f. rosea IK726]